MSTASSRQRASALVLPPAVDSALDWVFFVIGGVAVVWLAYLLVKASFSLGWWQIAFIVVFWVLLAYLVLPRLHKILTRIYVPDYFIGRARTSDGLLGDPVNLALLGSEPQIHQAMVGAGWIRADDLSFATGMRIVRSTVTRRSYPEAPVSPLLLFGRKQDFAYQQEVNGSPGKRHHVRFWRCPPDWKLPGGSSTDWLAAGTYDRAVGFSLFTLQVTHKIAADTDTERDHIISTVTSTDPNVSVRTIKDFSSGYHSRNGGGDAIVTDGNLPIIDVKKVIGPIASGPDEHTDSRDKRPSSTVFGSGFVAVRGIVAIGTAVVYWFLAANGDLAPGVSSDTPADLRSIAFIALGVLFLLYGLADVFLAWRVFLGRNWARVIVMSLATLSVLGAGIDAATEGKAITFGTNLPGLALDVLLIIALSSERSLTYARRHRKVPKRISGRPGNSAVI